MSTEVFGVFESRDAARSAEKALLDANFSEGEIQLRRAEDTDSAGVVPSGDDKRFLLVVTAPDPADQQRARDILTQSGARFIDAVEDRYHANRMIMDPDYSEEVADTDPSVTGIL